MKDLKITKGEWTYNKYSPCDYGVHSEEGDGRDIALVRSKKDEEESVANAKLITAAPELLQNCKWCLNNFREILPVATKTEAQLIYWELISHLESAIQKATE